MRVSPKTRQIISEVEANLATIHAQIEREISRLEELPGTQKYIKRVGRRLIQQIRRSSASGFSDPDARSS